MELKPTFKLSLIFLLAAAPASMVLAQPSDASPCSFSGFTLGVGLGATTLMSDLSSTTAGVSELPAIDIIIPALAPLNPTPGNTVNNYARANTYKYGVMGNIFVGYGYVFDNHAYLGGELGLNFLGANDATLKNTTTTNTTMTVTDSGQEAFGTGNYANSLFTKTKATRNSVEPFLDLKAGFLITPTALVYLRGGINYNTFKVKTEGSFNAAGNTSYSYNDGIETGASSTSTTSAFTASRKKSEIGYRAGIGMEVMVTPAFGVGADYVYSFYRTVKASSNTSSSDVACDIYEGCQVVGANMTNSSKANLSDQQVTAQLIYHFG
ncbi:hypothetical protein AQUSIP_00460 [Aquicella siphonis]|uniref:Uncharacterized protein n=1 Tax=Aquicella siphonis TaxID=254247 RepID=A0A5E4PDD2_9COXI|nr:outer membrane beta-barrel protein [Aquicella siphonis]VVC74774.1 hypothetical protein AQUSIP_00460 [Aquicella siphonis]